MEDIYDIVMYRFHRRYRLKKAVNLCITSVVAVLGITSFLYGLQYESFKTIFRWMTVDGTLFSTFCAIAFILVNLYEILGNTELTSIPIYYIISEIQKSVVPIRPDDGKTPRYENPRKSKFHHNKKSNL